MRSFRSTWLTFALMFCALAITPAPAHAWDAIWRSGPTYYTPACDPIVGGCQTNGTGYFVSQQWNPNTTPILPRAVVDNVGEVFYVSIYMQGIALLPRYMAVHFVPPEGTQIIVNSTVPVRCFYTPRNGVGRVEFTNQLYTDNTVAGPITIGGCPQPTLTGPDVPFPIVTLSSGAGTAYKLRRQKYCVEPCSQSDNWPMQSGAAYEFLIPLIATRPMDGFSDNNLFVAPISVLQSNFGIYWTYPRIALFASSNDIAPPPTADLRSTLKLGTSPMTGMTRVQGSCINGGPGTASNVRCTFGQLPLGASSTCTPNGAATLAANQAINCTADFPSQTSVLTVSLQVSGFANDANVTNDRATLPIDPPPPPPGTANLVATLTLGQGAAGRTRVVGRCTNFGPDAATSVACSYVGVPDGANVVCTPTSPVASLAKGEFVECVADFANQAAPLEVSLLASSPTFDPSTTDRTQALVVQPGGTAELFANGFE